MTLWKATTIMTTIIRIELLGEAKDISTPMTNEEVMMTIGDLRQTTIGRSSFDWKPNVDDVALRFD